MRVLTLLFAGLVSVGSSAALAASYQRTDGTIVDPIQCWSACVGDHPYSGIDLGPGIGLVVSSLSGADLRFADLSASGFFFTDFSGANLSGADLTGAVLADADLTGTDLSGANLTNAHIYSGWIGSPFYNANTDFTGAQLDAIVPFDPVAAGWTLVPEPSTALLMGLGLAGLASRRR